MYAKAVDLFGLLCFFLIMEKGFKMKKDILKMINDFGNWIYDSARNTFTFLLHDVDYTNAVSKTRLFDTLKIDVIIQDLSPLPDDKNRLKKRRFKKYQLKKDGKTIYTSVVDRYACIKYAYEMIKNVIYEIESNYCILDILKWERIGKFNDPTVYVYRYKISDDHILIIREEKHDAQAVRNICWYTESLYYNGILLYASPNLNDVLEEAKKIRDTVYPQIVGSQENPSI